MDSYLPPEARPRDYSCADLDAADERRADVYRMAAVPVRFWLQVAAAGAAVAMAFASWRWM